MRMIAQMKVKCFSVPLSLQTLILSLSLRGVDKFEIVTYVRDWLDCSQYDAIRVVESILGVCIND